ncbi:MAG: glutamine--tRNA ligase/YqeY domain fusion protein [Calditrichaeota bacterium]|nr:MAG: glutamine--tRNA ligase/YqeY domain fusion protein [Calditrichota bacterium]
MSSGKNNLNTEKENNVGKPSNFIKYIIDDDLKNGKNESRVHTRFPPEPNGYLHIGHAKSICLNFGVARDYNGLCNLRFDDTNPVKEEDEYVKSIIEDVKWLGFDWEDRLYFASDYFEQMYEYAVELIRKDKAYVDDLNAEQIREYRGTLTTAGKESPYRNRSVEESLDLFARMRAGEFPDGSKVLRAKIDMASSNMNMRDPVMYRILHASHHRTGDAWSIYPMYDWAHGLEDSLEGITHSICTLEFEDHRPLYDWFLENLDGVHHPQQIEFARLNLTYTLMSKRKLLRLVNENYVSGWDDPRMPTLAGMRRRGIPPASIRDFADRIGVAKADSIVDRAMLDSCIREDLNKNAKRVMVVLDPVKVVITNYPENTVEELTAENNPEDENAGHRTIPFSREIYIEREDFLEEAPKKFFRMVPGREVRLKHAYYVTCTNFVKNDAGELTEIHCEYDPATKGGWSDDGRKVKGTLHWVSVPHAIDAEVRLYDHLFTKENPDESRDERDFTEFLNPDSLVTLQNCKAEPGLRECTPGERFQFLRKGYFCSDSKEFTSEKPVFNRIVTMRDAWQKKDKK